MICDCVNGGYLHLWQCLTGKTVDQSVDLGVPTISGTAHRNAWCTHCVLLCSWIAFLLCTCCACLFSSPPLSYYILNYCILFMCSLNFFVVFLRFLGFESHLTYLTPEGRCHMIPISRDASFGGCEEHGMSEVRHSLRPEIHQKWRSHGEPMVSALMLVTNVGTSWYIIISLSQVCQKKNGVQSVPAL